MQKEREVEEREEETEGGRMQEEKRNIPYFPYFSRLIYKYESLEILLHPLESVWSIADVEYSTPTGRPIPLEKME